MRDKRIDFAKGMLMFCVIYGHMINALLSGTPHSPIWLHVFVRTFDMPFFMILSGYFLKRSLEKKKAPFVVRTITECGSETLALYILQSIVIERLLGMACNIAYKRYPVVLSNGVVNLVGYVIAPIMSFVAIVGLLHVIRCMRRTFLLKYAFGFKIR